MSIKKFFQDYNDIYYDDRNAEFQCSAYIKDY